MHDQKGYRYFVFLPELERIESGWEYREDARDQQLAWTDEGVPAKVYTRKYLVSKGFDPANDSNWGDPARNGGKTYEIKLIEKPRDYGIKGTIVGLGEDWLLAHEEPHDVEFFLRRYDYDKKIPPFWTPFVGDTVCFTVPLAIYLTLYDIFQVKEDLHDGDGIRWTWEGEDYEVVVSTWPTCEKCTALEEQFIADHGVDMDYVKAEHG
jgi:hypothetical protein